VVTSQLISTTEPVLTTHIDTVLSFVSNTGYGYQLFETKPQSYRYNVLEATKISFLDSTSPSAKGYSMISGSKYNFYQVNWHTPSENTVDGKHAIMEAHFVHQLNGMPDSNHRLAIISLMYDLGSSAECNTFLNIFWELFPQSKGVKKYAGLQNPSLKKMLEMHLSQGYYHWYGSLTTPPCTEGVHWNLLLTREKVCQQQVDMLKESLSSTNFGINFNNRVTQSLNHRAVALIQPSNARAKPTNTAILPALAPTWVYAPALALKADAAEQKKWGGLCSVGHEQSPINVMTMETAKAGKPTITTAFTT
jgi:carbonic anhydrase